MVLFHKPVFSSVSQCFTFIILAFEPKHVPRREFVSEEYNFFSSVSSPFPPLFFSHIKPLHQYFPSSGRDPHPHLPHPPAPGQSHWRALTLCGCLDCTIDFKAGVSMSIIMLCYSFWWAKTPERCWRINWWHEHLTSCLVKLNWHLKLLLFHSFVFPQRACTYYGDFLWHLKPFFLCTMANGSVRELEREIREVRSIPLQSLKSEWIHVWKTSTCFKINWILK